MKKITYIDLGLPSGTLWASSNSEIRGKRHFTYYEAMKNFGEQMPTAEQLRELLRNCKWQWTELFGGRVAGHRVTGPNGSSIFLPASGFYDGILLYCINSIGIFWSTTYSGDYAYGLGFGILGRDVYGYHKSHKFSVRTVKIKYS
jgi:hypothetical protein